VIQYEYHKVESREPWGLSVSVLNWLGAQGWELIGVLVSEQISPSIIVHFFKRQRLNEPVMCGHDNIWGEAAQGRAQP
jgi:hypothetical protein